jgi:RNase P subunit RPR2
MQKGSFYHTCHAETAPFTITAGSAPQPRHYASTLTTASRTLLPQPHKHCGNRKMRKNSQQRKLPPAPLRVPATQAAQRQQAGKSKMQTMLGKARALQTWLPLGKKRTLCRGCGYILLPSPRVTNEIPPVFIAPLVIKVRQPDHRQHSAGATQHPSRFTRSLSPGQIAQNSALAGSSKRR